jgi:hypothetical protein
MRATKAEIPKVNMNKPVVKTQIDNIFFPDLQSLTYDAAIAWLLFLALNPFTRWF